MQNVSDTKGLNDPHGQFVELDGVVSDGGVEGKAVTGPTHN